MRDEPDADLTMVAALHVVDLDDGDLRALPGPAGAVSLSHPSFSPDGTRIAALAEDVALAPSLGRVVVVGADGGEPTVLTDDLDRQAAPFVGVRPPIWSGEHLVFAVEDHGTQPLYRVPASGGAPEPLLGGTRAIVAHDQAGGTLAVVCTSPTERPELSVVRDGRETRLTSFSAAFHRDLPAGTPEHLRVPSPGGGEIDAWLLRPAAGADDRVPLLLSVHGGPMTQYPTAWFDEFALWSAAGYAVLWCNPHGSTGDTEEFLRSIRPPESAEVPGTGWGGVDADDVLAALDAALAHDPSLDPARVGLLGGSYGGFMTTWLVAHSDRFAAACSERAANNILSLEWGGSDLAGHFRFEMGGLSHLEAPEMYRRLSPVSHAEGIRTPMLILHSENDLRCPPEQADQLYLALRLLGRDVEYWRFPDEGHELSRSGSPWHRIQRAEIILDFFGRKLRPV
ncbi:S9 family peptidase [Actinomycetospora atypica]|uniref:S9 family peptidase n=1 Tax=Actinomycetospora atypica TaxID=1290095 RepID=A0ABV9YSC2_9PSEU